MIIKATITYRRKGLSFRVRRIFVRNFVDTEVKIIWKRATVLQLSLELRNRPPLTEESLWLSGRATERKSEGLRFDSSWGLRIFSLSHARDKTKKHLS